MLPIVQYAICVALYRFGEGLGQTVPLTHDALCCLNPIVQRLLCLSDIRLLYKEDGKVFGDGQVRECREWEGLKGWTVKH